MTKRYDFFCGCGRVHVNRTERRQALHEWRLRAAWAFRRDRLFVRRRTRVAMARHPVVSVAVRLLLIIVAGILIGTAFSS